MDITFITGNLGKVAQVKQYLSYPIAHRKLDLVEIQSLNSVDVVKHKAEEAYSLIGTPVLIEDTSLIFLALGKLPGTLIKWFLNELGKPGLCKLLNSFSDRSAIAQVCFALYDGKQLQTFEGQVKGSIATEPRGDGDFGWGPIFIPDGYNQTWGEMSSEAMDATSVRKIALTKLEAYLTKFR